MEQSQSVQEYYGKVLSSNKDLQTTACCSPEDMSDELKTMIKNIHPEVIEKFYGCGAPLPPALKNCTVLDLGSGSGRDVYLASQLVGPEGRVIGIDMTDEQLEVAKRHEKHHMDQFGYSQSNVEFRKGYIEDLKAAGIEDNSVDLIISNCVINLSPDKEAVFSEMFRVLKPGGEIYFSDVFCDRRLPASFQEDPVLLGECLGGALYTEDFRRMLMKNNCLDYRVCASSPIEVTNKKIADKLGPAKFFSLTIRAFKVDVEDRCEDYGQVAYYKGTIEGLPHIFDLDDHHRFETNRPLLVCSNTAKMLSETRFAPHFRIEGDLSAHFGLFDCGPESIQSVTTDSNVGACC